MEKDLILLILFLSFVISYFSFWIYVFFFKYPKEIKNRTTFILKEFDNNKNIIVKDLLKEKTITISKENNWIFEENKFIKNDCYLILEELINPSYYKIEQIKERI